MAIDKYADDLRSEVMTEMAESFFSRRVQLEENLDHLHRLVTRIRPIGMETLRRWRTLYQLLLGGEEAAAFLSSLGGDPAHLLSFSMPFGELCLLRQPMALTMRGKYVKTVLRCYEELRKSALDYVEGAYVADARDSRKKRRVPGLNQVKAMCDEINREVCAVNERQSPYCVLNFAKSLDPVRAHQERIAGAVVDGDATRIDKDLAFLPVVFEDLGLPDIPTPPPLERVHTDVVRLCKALFDEHRERIGEILEKTEA